MRVGDVIKISAPRNNFPLVENAEHVAFFAGGIGITPIWCMVQQLAAANRSWKLFYACRSRADMAFLDSTGKIRPKIPCICISTMKPTAMFLDLAAVIAETPADAHLYCCGPNPMLKAFEAAAANRPRNQIHVEYFTPEGGSSDDGRFLGRTRALGRGIFHPRGQENPRSAL